MNNSPYIIDITLENFQQVILEGSQQLPVLVNFWGESCAPCKVLLPVLHKLAEEFQGQFILAKVNTDTQPELTQQFQVRSVPTVLLVSQGQLVDQFNGVKPESELRAFLKQHLTNPVDALKEQIKLLIGEGELDQAQALLAQAVEQLPDDIDLQIDLARVLLQKNLASEAKAVLDKKEAEAEKAEEAKKAIEQDEPLTAENAVEAKKVTAAAEEKAEAKTETKTKEVDSTEEAKEADSEKDNEAKTEE